MITLYDILVDDARDELHTTIYGGAYNNSSVQCGLTLDRLHEQKKSVRRNIEQLSRVKRILSPMNKECSGGAEATRDLGRVKDALAELDGTYKMIVGEVRHHSIKKRVFLYKEREVM